MSKRILFSIILFCALLAGSAIGAYYMASEFPAGLGVYMGTAVFFVVGIIVLFYMWYIFLQISIFARYGRNNKIHLGGAKTARNVAESLLNKFGYTDIKVERASWIWFIIFPIWGNRYSPKRKTIYLFDNILNNDSVTAVALATQKVGLVRLHKEGNKLMNFRTKIEFWARVMPGMLVPFIALGYLFDYYVIKTGGIFTLAFMGIAIVYMVFAVIVAFLVIPTEKKACNYALNMIQEADLVPQEYIEKIQGLYNTYVQKYIADFIYTILQLINTIIKFATLIKKQQ